MKIDSDQCSRSVWALGLLWAICFVSHAHFCFVFQKLAVLKAAFQQDLFQNAKNGFVTRVILHFFCISCHMIDPCDHIADKQNGENGVNYKKSGDFQTDFLNTAKIDLLSVQFCIY